MYPAVLNQLADQHTAERRCDTTADIRARRDDRGSVTNGFAIDVTPIRVTPDRPADGIVTDARTGTPGGRLSKLLWLHLDPFWLMERGLRHRYTQAKPDPPPTPNRTSRNPDSLEKIATFTTVRSRATTILICLLLLVVLAAAAHASLQGHDNPRAPAPANQNPAGAGNGGGAGPPRFQ
jgi:hypothetical protein